MGFDVGVVGVLLRESDSGRITLASGPAGLTGDLNEDPYTDPSGLAGEAWWGPDLVAMYHRMWVLLSKEPLDEKEVNPTTPSYT